MGEECGRTGSCGNSKACLCLNAPSILSGATDSQLERASVWGVSRLGAWGWGMGRGWAARHRQPGRTSVASLAATATGKIFTTSFLGLRSLENSSRPPLGLQPRPIFAELRKRTDICDDADWDHVSKHLQGKNLSTFPSV